MPYIHFYVALIIMADLKGRKIKNGLIIGTVRTNKVGSECEFEICSVEEWEKLTEDEAEKLAIEAMNESGMVEMWW